MWSTKVVAACIFINKLQVAGLFLALDGTSTHIDPSTSGKKYRKLVNIANFIFVSFSLTPKYCASVCYWARNSFPKVVTAIACREYTHTHTHTHTHTYIYILFDG